jgi:hypothetical protein
MRRLLAVIGLVTTSALSTVPAAEASVTTNTTVPIDIVVFVPCANAGDGELVELTGVLHLLTTSTSNGNSVSGNSLSQPQGVTGAGLTTGVVYHGTGITETTFVASLQSGQAAVTFVNNFRVIGQGSGNNLLVHETFHLTINGSGDVTAVVDNFSSSCI